MKEKKNEERRRRRRRKKKQKQKKKTKKTINKKNNTKKNNKMGESKLPEARQGRSDLRSQAGDQGSSSMTGIQEDGQDGK
mmetsp:Transcript_37013/g.80392  ORF Transcript_37013/g.80392 Transcript_37013/m.80392 type:complete len:80 (+) Transcript_37013:64-303(+)